MDRRSIHFDGLPWAPTPPIPTGEITREDLALLAGVYPLGQVEGHVTLTWHTGFEADGGLGSLFYRTGEATGAWSAESVESTSWSLGTRPAHSWSMT